MVKQNNNKKLSGTETALKLCKEALKVQLWKPFRKLKELFIDQDPFDRLRQCLIAWKENVTKGGTAQEFCTMLKPSKTS